VSGLAEGAQEPGGAFLTFDEARELARARCTTCRDDETIEAWVGQNLAWAERVAPEERYPAFVLAEAVLFTTLGMGCLLPAVPVLRR
jgi:hypothetical protein